MNLSGNGTLCEHDVFNLMQMLKNDENIDTVTEQIFFGDSIKEDVKVVD